MSATSGTGGTGRGEGLAAWAAIYGPGLSLVLVVAVAARLAAGVLPSVVGEVIIAILLGLLIKNVVGVPAALQKGVRFSLHTLLRLGIVLLGIRLSFIDVVRIGLGSLLIVLVCMTIALLFTYYAGRLVRLPSRLALLIGVGTAVCGNSAIIATAPVVEAKDEEVSFAVATITLFGTLAVFVYPLVGRLIGMPDNVFGTWAGTAVNDTSQVVATGFAYSDAAGQVATVVKLTRNSLMAPLIVLLGYLYVRGSQRELSAKGAAAARMSLVKVFPWFVLGFVGMAVINTVGLSLGIMPKPVAQGVYDLARFLILMALAGVGLGTSLQAMRRTGLRPFYLGLGAASVLAAVSFTLVNALVR